MGFLGGDFSGGSFDAFPTGTTGVPGSSGIPGVGGSSTGGGSSWQGLLTAAIPSLAGLFSGIISSNAAGNAASTQANAALEAAKVQQQTALTALALQNQQFQTGQANLAPYLNVGSSGLYALSYLMGLPLQQTAQLAAQNPQLAQIAGYNTNGAANVSGSPTGGIPIGDATNPNGTVQAGLEGQGGFAQGLRNFQSYYGGARPVTADASVSGMQRPNATTGAPLMPGIMQDVPERQPGAISAGSTVNGANPLSVLANRNSTGTNTNTVTTPNPIINPNIGPFGSLSQGFGERFTAPTNVTEQNDPGYQFRLMQGLKAIQNSAASRGGLLSGGTAKSLGNYAQDYASGEYGNVYNRAMGEYLNRYNIYNQNQTNLFNRLAAISGIGQTSASQLTNAGQNFANSSGTILQNSGNAQAQGINNAAAARASGYVGGANALSSSINNSANNLQQLLLLQQYGL